MMGDDLNTGTTWPSCGETDIMEFEQQYFTGGNQISGTVHYPNSYTATVYDFPSGQYVYSAYHTYSILWTPSEIQCYVDYSASNPNPYATYTPASVGISSTLWNATFDQPFFFLLNDAVGGNLGGTVSPSTSFPATMFVDYVRVYEPTTPTPTVTSTPTPTLTPTSTPTPCPSCPPTATPTPPVNTSQSVVFPNPSRGGPVSVVVSGLMGPQVVEVEVFTTAFRKVQSQKYQGLSVRGGVLAGPIEPVDDQGNKLASGLYYLMVSAGGQNTVLKWLLLR
jgi:beta-glucanase (GH16 family)